MGVVICLTSSNFQFTSNLPINNVFLRTLQEKGLLLRNWTENIDNLEKLSGIKEEKIVEFQVRMNEYCMFSCSCFDF